MIPKNGNRFSERIMLKQELSPAGGRALFLTWIKSGRSAG
jgi:hypothetical protein